LEEGISEHQAARRLSKYSHTESLIALNSKFATQLLLMVLEETHWLASTSHSFSKSHRHLKGK
jgi:hypothetical protein